MALTIADNGVDDMKTALRSLIRARDRRRILEQELAEAQNAIDAAAEAIYIATLYDPEGERDDA